MQNSKCNILVRGFTLIEVLVVIVILSLLLLGSVSLTVKYSSDLQWSRLFHRLEQLVLDVNTYALAGLSLGFVDGNSVDDLPDMYHLFIQKGEPLVWYLESRAAEGHERRVVFQEQHDVEVDVMDLEEVFLKSEDGTEDLEHVLLTWTKPYAQLKFYGDADVQFSGGNVEEYLELGDESDLCDENCLLGLVYRRAGAEEHSIFFDLQKGIYRGVFNE